MSERECGRVREKGGNPWYHRGPQRRRSPSPVVRYFRGDQVQSRVPPNGGVRGEWSVVRPRRRKAPKQVEERWDRVREDQRQGGSRQQRYMQSRVRVRSASTSQYRFPEGQQFYSDQDSFYDYFSSYDHHHFFRD